MSTRHESADGEREKPPELPSHAVFLGRDGEGHDHWYSRIEHSAWIDADGELDEHNLSPGPIETPGEWARHVRAVRGEWDVLLLGPFPDTEVQALAEGVKDRIDYYGGTR